MAKRKGFDFGSFMDIDALNELSNMESSIAPNEKEVEIVKNSAGDVEFVSVADLAEYHNHTYRVLDNEDMEALIDSIKEMGIILPLLVRRTSKGKLEIVSGHRRLFAAKKLGLEEVPCKILDIDEATADIMMVDTNLHREEILPSEKAKSYDVRIKAMKRKGLLGEEEGSNSQYEELLAKDVKSSKVNVYRYRKLLKLNKPLLDLVDKKEISVNAGAKLASVPKDQQACITEALKEAKNPITMEAADKIATASRTGLTKDKVLGILDGEFKPRKPKVETPKKSISEKNFKSVYPKTIKGLSGAEKEAFIIECIEAYIKDNSEWNGYSLK